MGDKKKTWVLHISIVLWSDQVIVEGLLTTYRPIDCLPDSGPQLASVVCDASATLTPYSVSVGLTRSRHVSSRTQTRLGALRHLSFHTAQCSDMQSVEWKNLAEPELTILAQKGPTAQLPQVRHYQLVRIRNIWLVVRQQTVMEIDSVEMLIGTDLQQRSVREHFWRHFGMFLALCLILKYFFPALLLKLI